MNPYQAYLVFGTVRDSVGSIEENAKIKITTSLGISTNITTNSNGQFIYDISFLGYVDGEIATVSSEDKFNNEISTDTFTINMSTGFTELSLSLSTRTHALDATDYSPKSILHSVGKSPITITNPLFSTLTNQDIVGYARIDKSTETMQTIEYEHHEIHDGSHYFIASFTTLDSAAVINFSVTTPNTTKEIHMLFEVQGTQNTDIELFEGSAFDMDGTQVIPLNNNRNSSKVSVLNVRTGNTVTTDGTLLSGQSFGVAGNQNKSKSGGAKREQEIILKQNTKYIFRVTSNGAGNIVSYRAEWYEHTPKN